MNGAPSVFSPDSPQAQSIYSLMMGVLGLSAVIFVLVVGLITYAIIRFRARRGAPDPKPNYGNKRLEFLWTAIPLFTLVVVMIFTVRTMIAVSPGELPGKPDLVVTGYQWWWDVRYPKRNVVTANEIHIPVMKRLLLEIRSGDVVHDFWVPQLGRKIDAIPGHPNRIWLEADRLGTYLGFCAQFCGASHAWMRIRVMADTELNFGKWAEEQARPALVPRSEQQRRGLRAFQDRTCGNCHEIRGVTRPVQVAPDLTHFASRVTLGAGVFENTHQNLVRWLENPGRVKPGVNMPAFGFKAEELNELTAYLESLK